MPIRHDGILAKRASTWLRDHFWRNTMPPRSSKPTTWNEFLPISIPITVIVLLSLWDMGCSLSLAPLARFVAGGAGARPDHPISGQPNAQTASAVKTEKLTFTPTFLHLPYVIARCSR